MIFERKRAGVDLGKRERERGVDLGKREREGEGFPNIFNCLLNKFSEDFQIKAQRKIHEFKGK